jgi:hypothetical protein
MSLLSGEPRTATIRAVEDTTLLRIAKQDFEQLVAADPELAEAVQRISHQRAISNLSAGGTNAAKWAKVANGSLDHLNRHETGKMLVEAGNGAGMAIVFGNILDTIPGCLVIGAKFTAFGNLSLTLMLGMFLGGIPEAAASASMLTKAGYRPAGIFGLWSTVLLAGVIAAAAGKAFIGSSDALTAIFAQALAGGAVLALRWKKAARSWCSRPSPAFCSRSIWRWPNPSFDEIPVSRVKKNRASVLIQSEPRLPSRHIATNCRASDPVHAVGDIEPAVVADEPLRPYFGAAGFQLGPVLDPFRAHLLEMFDSQFHSGRFCSGRRRLGRSHIEAAGDKQHGGETNTDAKHWDSPDLVS